MIAVSRGAPPKRASSGARQLDPAAPLHHVLPGCRLATLGTTGCSTAGGSSCGAPLEARFGGAPRDTSIKARAAPAGPDASSTRGSPIARRTSRDLHFSEHVLTKRVPVTMGNSRTSSEYPHLYPHFVIGTSQERSLTSAEFTSNREGSRENRLKLCHKSIKIACANPVSSLRPKKGPVTRDPTDDAGRFPANDQTPTPNAKAAASARLMTPHAVTPDAAAVDAVSAAAAAAASGAAAAVARPPHRYNGALEPRSASSRRRRVVRPPARAMAYVSRRHSRASSFLSPFPHPIDAFSGHKADRSIGELIYGRFATCQSRRALRVIRVPRSK